MKHSNATILSALALLSACQAPADKAPLNSAPISYKAIGTEPFWSLYIKNGEMILDHSGEVTAKAKSFEARQRANGWRYVAKEMTADITFTECGDGMSEFTHKDSVIVMVGDQKYEGCGGGILPPDALDRTSWRIISINGTAMKRAESATVSFDAERMSGSVGCNQIGANYRYNAKKLSLGPIIATEMGCPAPLDAIENAFVSVLGALASTEFPGDATMVLTGKDGAKVVLAQLM
jgi:heat shock protein HslJ